MASTTQKFKFLKGCAARPPPHVYMVAPVEKLYLPLPCFHLLFVFYGTLHMIQFIYYIQNKCLHLFQVPKT